MFVVCCVPYQTRRDVVITWKTKEVIAGEETLLCTLELKRKDTSANMNDIRLAYELFARSSLVDEPNVAYCYLSLESRYKCNVFINVSLTTVVKLNTVKLDLGWKFRLVDNKVKFALKTPISNQLSSCRSTPNLKIFRTVSLDQYKSRLATQVNEFPLSPFYGSLKHRSLESSFALSDYEISKKTTSYYLTNSHACAHRSSVIAEIFPDGIDVIKAGTPVHFKLTIRNEHGEALPKKTKSKLSVKLGEETIFAGETHKTVFKLTKTETGVFSIFFFINNERIPFNPFHLTVISREACSLSNFVFKEENPFVKQYKPQTKAMYTFVNMICQADIVDKYGNKVHKNHSIKIISKPIINITGVDAYDGAIFFKARSEITGQVELDFLVREVDLNDEFTFKKVVQVRHVTLDDQYDI